MSVVLNIVHQKAMRAMLSQVKILISQELSWDHAKSKDFIGNKYYCKLLKISFIFSL
jgi:hypothetical protein